MLPLLQDEVTTWYGKTHYGYYTQVHQKLKLDQPVVITANQSVYAIGKQVQWLYLDE